VDIEIFTQRESNVRSYCRAFPAVFHHAKNATIYGETGEAYIDFFAGAGALNYGHNNDYIKEQIISYLENDGITHSLDMYTSAKRAFLETFSRQILVPRNLDYKVMFCGPTGTNAVESALKLARKTTQRTNIFSFMGGYHGHSLGSLAATGNHGHRKAAGLPLTNVSVMPYPYGFMNNFDTIEYMESVLTDPNSGIDKPAAILFETVQAEGGIIVAPQEWMQRLRALCDRHAILLICDDIQVGCGRTGSFFSFERAGIVPDMVTLSKSISGYGLPMSLLLMKADYDNWQPAEHTGTFRGNQLAFVGATAAIEYYERWNVDAQVKEKGGYLEKFLHEEIASIHPDIEIRGIGMIWGIDVARVGGSEFAQSVAKYCFKEGLIVECAGRNDTVLKILPPLVIEHELLQKGCQIIRQAMKHCLAREE
jgi:diaminobutyrate-2-oxoglutarate transaminase